MLRIYHPHSLLLGQSIQLEKASAHHVSRVLRARQNDLIHLFDGLGMEVRGIIQHLNKDQVVVLLEKEIPVNMESNLKIHLGQALLHREKMDWVIQKAVELGVTAITPIITERSQPKLSDERHQKRQLHWQNIIINACEQCGRAYLPQLYDPMDFSQWVKATNGFLCDPLAEMRIHQLKISQNDMSILIGPEGGLTAKEIDFAKQNQWQTVTLGPRILRTETAAISMMAIVQALAGDI